MARITHLLSALSLLSTVSLSVQGFNMGSDFSSLNRPRVDSPNPDLISFDQYQSEISFASFFTFSPNLIGTFDQNTTLAFVVVPSSFTSVNLFTARKTWSVEFTSTISACSTPGGGGWLGFQVSEYSDGSQVSAGETPCDGSTMLCSHQNAPYEVLVEYNATSKTVFVASPSCVDCPSYINFPVDLSSVVDHKLPLQIGFIVSDGASTYNVSNANFTVITAPTSFLASILPETPAPTTTFNTSTSTSSSDSAPGGSSHKIGKGYVVAFSVLGSGIAIAAAFGVFLLCRRLAAKRSAPAVPLRRVQDEGTAVVVETTRLSPPPPPQNHNKNLRSERDTAPPPTPPPAFEVSGTTSWFQALTAR